MTKEQIEVLNLQRLDGLSLAEKITGKDYKTDQETESLGFLFHIQHGQLLREMLESIDDTQFSNSVDNYLRITEKFGFKIVYREPFIYEGRDETLYVLFLEELGIIIHFDSFSYEKGGKHTVNGGKMFYNWSPDSAKHSNLTSSGGFYFAEKRRPITLFEKDLSTKYLIPDFPEDVLWDYNSESYEDYQKKSAPVSEKQKALFDTAISGGKRVLWVGDHDCREAVITNIKSLFENGKFFPVWQSCPFYWIINYAEVKQDKESWFELTRNRIEKMPDSVKRCINNTYKK